jgi:hypothetical protein
MNSDSFVMLQRGESALRAAPNAGLMGPPGCSRRTSVTAGLRTRRHGFSFAPLML